MAVEQTIDLSNENRTNIYISSSTYSTSYMIEFSSFNEETKIILSKSQVKELIEKLVGEDMITIDENGDIQVEV